MFKFSVLLLTVTLAYSYALNYQGPIVKKQAIYPNSIPQQNFAHAAPQNAPVADPNVQFQQTQEPSIRSIGSQQAYLVQQQQQQQLQQPQQPQQQLNVQPTVYAAAQPQQQQPQPQQQQLAQSAIYAAAQQQPQQYPYLRQFQYYPQQQFYQPQQPIYPSVNGPANVFYIPNQKPIGDGIDQQSGNGGWYGGSGWYPPSFQWPNFPSFPAQFPGGFPDVGSLPTNPFYPSNGASNTPAGGTTNGPDSVVTVASGNDAPGASDGNSIVLVGGSRPKPEKIDAVRQDVPQQQYVFVPQQQQVYGQAANGQNDREIAQLNGAAKGAISSYLIYKDAAQKVPQQQYVQQLVPQPGLTQQAVLPQQFAPQQVVPQQVLIPQQISPQQVAPQQVSQQQASPNSLIAQQLNAQQLDAQQLNAQQLDAQQLSGQQLLQQQLVQQQQQQQQQQQFAEQQQPQQQLISPQQLVPQQQLVQQQIAPQQQLVPQQFINQFVPSEQKPSDLANSQDSASTAYQRFLLQSRQRSEEPSLKSGFKVEENFPSTESPAVTTNSVDVADITRSSGSSSEAFQNFGARIKGYSPSPIASQQVSHAEAAPNAISYAGIGGVAGAAPVGTAVTGKGGKASSAPRGIAIAGTSNEAPEFNIVPARSAPSSRHSVSIAKYSPERGYHIAKNAHLDQLQQLEQVQQVRQVQQVQQPPQQQHHYQHHQQAHNLQQQQQNQYRSLLEQQNA